MQRQILGQNLTLNDRVLGGVLGTQTRGGRMEGRDQSPERPMAAPLEKYFDFCSPWRVPLFD